MEILNSNHKGWIYKTDRYFHELAPKGEFTVLYNSFYENSTTVLPGRTILEVVQKHRNHLFNVGRQFGVALTMDTTQKVFPDGKRRIDVEIRSFAPLNGNKDMWKNVLEALIKPPEE